MPTVNNTIHFVVVVVVISSSLFYFANQIATHTANAKA